MSDDKKKVVPQDKPVDKKKLAPQDNPPPPEPNAGQKNKTGNQKITPDGGQQVMPPPGHQQRGEKVVPVKHF